MQGWRKLQSPETQPSPKGSRHSHDVSPFTPCPPFQVGVPSEPQDEEEEVILKEYPSRQDRTSPTSIPVITQCAGPAVLTEAPGTRRKQGLPPQLPCVL